MWWGGCEDSAGRTREPSLFKANPFAALRPPRGASLAGEHEPFKELLRFINRELGAG